MLLTKESPAFSAWQRLIELALETVHKTKIMIWPPDIDRLQKVHGPLIKTKEAKSSWKGVWPFFLPIRTWTG
jgi:hypothetical protein